MNRRRYHARLSEASQRRTMPSTGEWVVVAVVVKAGSKARHGIPFLDARGPEQLQRFATAEAAVAASIEHSASRVGGGWVMNLRTGTTLRFPSTPDLHRVMVP